MGIQGKPFASPCFVTMCGDPINKLKGNDRATSGKAAGEFWNERVAEWNEGEWLPRIRCRSLRIFSIFRQFAKSSYHQIPCAQTNQNTEYTLRLLERKDHIGLDELERQYGDKLGCFLILYNFHYISKDGRKKKQIINWSFIHNQAKIKEKMLFAVNIPKFYLLC